MKPTNMPAKAVALIGSLKVTVAGLIILAILVVWGTLYQVDNGIYAAQERFFHAWFIFIGRYIPFPAVKTVVALLSINLLAAAFRKRPINIRTAGMIIMHLGVAALIGGAALSSGIVKESAITLAKGQQTAESYDFTTWQMSLSVSGFNNGTPFSKTTRYDLRRLHQGGQIRLSPASSTITIRRIHRNCVATLGSDQTTITGLSPHTASAERDRNMPGIVFSVNRGGGAGTTGDEYYAWAGSPMPVIISSGNDSIVVTLHPEVMPLPLRVTLNKFTVEWHPGTAKAKRFESRLRVFGKNIDREVVIEMNRPFRYRSFTFYQMGYSKRDGSYVPTIAIVKNPLKYLPYVSSLIIVAGLFLHFFIKMLHQLSSNRSDRRE